MRRLSKISVDVARQRADRRCLGGRRRRDRRSSLPTIAHTVSAEPRRVASMLALTLVLQLFSVPVYGRGGVGVSAIGILATALPPEHRNRDGSRRRRALSCTGRAGAETSTRRSSTPGNFVLAAAAAGATFHALDGTSRLLAAAVAGCVYAALNNGLVCLAMSLAEGVALATWSGASGSTGRATTSSSSGRSRSSPRPRTGSWACKDCSRSPCRPR